MRLATACAVARSATLCPSRKAFSISLTYWQPAQGRTRVRRLTSSNCRRSFILLGKVPAITHAVGGFYRIEFFIRGEKFFANTFHMGGNGVVIQHNLGGVHQLLPTFYVTGMLH